MTGTINTIITKLFKERWTANLADATLDMQKAQLHKTLKDQLNGYWSGHTAYHLAVDGGFLIDSKNGSHKRLTELGKMFMQEMEVR